MTATGKIAVKARFSEVPKSTKRRIFQMIDKAFLNKNKRYQFTDENKISYCVSFEEGKLLVSVVDDLPYPNASILPMLVDRFGEPTMKYAKPHRFDPKATFFVMCWDDFFNKGIVH
ncbi:hypothetical protein NYE70_25950 [Paenibacillus sp. FSL R5-0407]|uniref:hypothetical protein n=1 Tax=Paenibacillus sp. FSL R5-0407 TaxID=2975320 RepID=UPI0030FA9E6D